MRPLIIRTQALARGEQTIVNMTPRMKPRQGRFRDIDGYAPAPRAPPPTSLWTFAGQFAFDEQSAQQFSPLNDNESPLAKRECM
ncbi:hypothetical protein GCM10023115_21290 [Pontixanthobacter gangjinensis]